MSSRSLLVLLVAALLFRWLPSPEPAGAAEGACSFALGFAALREQIPRVVGECVEDEWHNPENGDGLQQTTGGLLVWRKADNWTAFTDGTTTWINGPVGLVSRPNAGAPYPWEATPAAGSGTAPDGPARLTHGPLLGAVTDRAVRVWARSDRPARLQLEVKQSGRSWSGRTPGDVSLASEHDFTGVAEVTGLQPNTEYEYRPLLSGVVQDDFGGTFRTLPAAGKPGAFRFALGGDLSAAYAPFTILDRIQEQRPDFSLLVGDLIYADQPEPIPADTEAYAAKYRANWSEPSFRRLTRSVPSFMMWDDHEIGNDYDGGKAGPYPPARTAQEVYVASHNPTPLRPDELYFTFRAANVEFFVLDTRSFRSPRAQPDGSGKTMLGADQKRALQAWLAESQAPFKVVVSSVPFHDFGGERPDAWGGYATERTELFEFVRRRRIAGVVALSGDQHWSSLVRHDPFGIWEFNATPLAQAIGAHPAASDPRLVLAYDATPAFGLVEVDTRGASPKMTFMIFDAAGQQRGSVSIAPGKPD